MSDDVSATLDALERKLRELERELAEVAPAAAPAVAPPVAPSTGAGLDELASQIDDLGRYRERLARTARELEDEYGRVLGRLEGLSGVSGPPPERGRVPDAAAAAEVWLLDAGPFADLAALGSFERALAALGDVAVMGFEGRRAQIELRTDGAPDLAAALPGATVHVEATGRLRVEL